MARQQAAARRAGVIAASIYNASGNFKRTYRPNDFYSDGKAGTRAPTAEERRKLEHRMAPSKSIRT